jgi:hypothetical protein
MAVDTSLLDWLLSLLRDPFAREEFLRDPQGYLNQCGFSDVSGRDLQDALDRISRDDRDDRDDHDDHGRDHDHGHHYPRPHHYDHDHDHSPAHYLASYVTNNYTTIEEHNTYLDNSVHQDIDTHGGDFSQVIDNDPVVASGNGAVAAGGDIRDATVTTGDGNVVGNNNQATTGDDNTTAFGSGNATKADLDHARFGDGGALSVGGSADGHSTDNDTTTAVHNSGSGDASVNAAGSHGAANEFADQHESDSSSHASYADNSHLDSHDDVNSHNDGRFTDSHDVDVHHV